WTAQLVELRVKELEVHDLSPGKHVVYH
ncbi:hypothetical protein A2U01_0091262, partial [Trifolium medium]|nr:hypothetical protein [Trifolium medium]